MEIASRDRTSHEERVRCIRTLLVSPLITANGARAEEFKAIRRHTAWLSEWFSREAGWRLTVENEFARLAKYPASHRDGSRPAYDPKKHIPFSRQRYVMLCLTLAVLERSERQTVLGRIAEEMTRLAHGDAELSAAGMAFNLEDRECRTDLVAVIRVLIGWGVLERIHGSEDAFIQSSEDVLYTIRRPILANLLCVQRGPSTIDESDFHTRLMRIQSESTPESDEGRRRRLRITLTRMLLDNPIVYYSDLTEEELAYLHSQRTRLIAELEQATGLLGEVRLEGIAMVDPEQELTDHPMPEEGTRGHAALLLAEFLSNALRDNNNVEVSLSALEGLMKRLAKENKTYWRKGVGVPGGETALLREVLDIFEALGLIRRTKDTVVPMPAIGRYRLKEVRIESLGTDSPLFDN